MNIDMSEKIDLNIPNLNENLYLPRMLYLRLKHRENIKFFIAFYTVFNIFAIILGALYLDAAGNTKKYISNIIDFWDFYKINTLVRKEIPLMATFSGIFLLCLGVFNLMNMIVIIKHVFIGGLRIRLKILSYLYLIFQIILFAYSIFPIAKYQVIIVLNVILLILAFANLFFCIFFFMLLRRIFRKESRYMLPLNLLYYHKQEYLNDYINKIYETRAEMKKKNNFIDKVDSNTDNRPPA